MTNGYTYLLTVRFVRALAFLSEQEIRDMVREVESETQCKYSKELIIQAINMAPQCRLEQTISNLVNNAVRVCLSAPIVPSESELMNYGP